MPTESVGVTVITDASAVVRSGANQGALLAPLDGSATVSANVVKRYRRSSDAESDHGTGSKIADGVAAALGAGLPTVFTVGVDAASGSPSTDNFSAKTGTLTAANLPVTEVTSASLTGDDTASPTNVTYTVKYTVEDPITTSPGTDEILINTETGDFSADDSSLGTAESISSIDITYTHHDWDSALDKLDLEAYEYHTLAGFTLKAQNLGIWNKLMTHAKEENKVVAMALPTGESTTDASTVTAALKNGDRAYVVAAHYGTEDLTSAIMAHRARDSVNATAKEQIAPRNITFDDSYVFTDFGGEESPTSGTFHYDGVNAVYKDKGGTYRLTNDRSITGLTDFYRFHSTRRSVRYAENRIEEDLLALRRGSGESLPFTEGGLAAVRSTIQGSLGHLRDQGIIDEGTVTVPRLSEVDDTDRLNRVLDLVEVSIRLTGQIHYIDLDLKVDV